MNISRMINVMALGFGLVSTGCIATAEDLDADAIVALDKETLNGGGGQIPNGLRSERFLADLPALSAIMNVKLTGYDNVQVSSTVASSGIFTVGDDGDKTFQYAVECALVEYAAPHSYIYGNGQYHFGQHVMTSGTGWWTGGLSQSAQNDLMTCMITRLNPQGATVDILLKGKNVRSDGGNHADFTFPEARWTAKVDLSGAWQFRVWPSDALSRRCGGALTSQHVTTRTCGTTEGIGCNLIVELNQELCTDIDADGAYTCDGQDAVETFLDADDVQLLYPHCN